MTIQFLPCALLVATLVVGCGSQQEAPDATNEKNSIPENITMSAPVPADLASPPPAPEAPGPPAGAGVTSGATPASATPASTRKLIYHADVRIKVADLSRTNARIDSLTQAFGAYVSEAEEERQTEQWQHQMKIRVAPSRFQAFLAQLNGLGTLESKTLRTDDVTAEHADIAARLRTKRAVEQRYVALLSQAKKISDILEIEEKIGEVREAIESTESRLKTLDDEVAYSTITLTYFQLISQPTPEAPLLSFQSRFVESFYTGWKMLTGVVLLLVSAWPLWLLGGLALLGIRSWRRRDAV